MKNIFKDWNIFEIVLLFASLVVLTVGLVFGSDALTVITPIVGIICAILVAKGLLLGQYFGVVVALLYSILCFQNGFYGEIMIYIFIMLPMYILSIIYWNNNQSSGTKSVKVDPINWKEWGMIFIFAVLAFIGFYYLLGFLGTNELIVSTLSVVGNVFTVYILARKCKYSYLSYLVNDLILIMLWGIPVIKGNLLLLAMLIYPIVNLINDIYCVINLTKMHSPQK